MATSNENVPLITDGYAETRCITHSESDREGFIVVFGKPFPNRMNPKYKKPNSRDGDFKPNLITDLPVIKRSKGLG